MKINYEDSFREIIEKAISKSIPETQRQEMVDTIVRKELSGEHWHDDFKIAYFLGMDWATTNNVKTDDGFIYLLHTEHGVKIGKSKNPDSRAKTLGTKLPFKIIKKESFHVKNMSEYESCLHEKYKSCKLNGEWFNLSGKQLEDIRTELNLAWVPKTK